MDNEQDESNSKSEDPKLDDLLALNLKLEPEGVLIEETTEMESGIRKEFSKVLSEPRKSLRRTFAFVGGIIHGYFKRGKSYINWIKIMRSNSFFFVLSFLLSFVFFFEKELEGREHEESKVSKQDPFIGFTLEIEQDTINHVSSLKIRRNFF